MSDVVVKPVSGWRDRGRFIDYPWSLYRNDPNWMPPLRGNQKELLNYSKHPFYKNAEIQTFLAWRDGEVCGRVAAIVNNEHNLRYEERRGFFGFFESENDPAISNALFDAVRKWLAERNIQKLRGPANPSMNYECGLLIDGFDSPPTFMMTYNPDYYPALIESYGFRKGHDLLAYMGYLEQLPELAAKLGPLVEQAKARSQATLRQIDLKRFVPDVEGFIDLYNRSLEVNWGHVPLPPEEMKKLAESLKHLLIPELTVFADVDGRAVGAIVGLPDYNPRVKKINGRLFPFGFLTLLGNRKGIGRIRVLSINVLPEYQRWGLGIVLMASLVPKGLELGMKEAEFSWIDEDNDLARMGLEKCGAKLYKTYRMYDYGPAEESK